jgi:hypothetical protein
MPQEPSSCSRSSFPWGSRAVQFVPGSQPPGSTKSVFFGMCGIFRAAGLQSSWGRATLNPDAEPSRKERGHRGVRPRHPNRKALGPDGKGSSSGPEPRRFCSPSRCGVRSRSVARGQRDRRAEQPEAERSAREMDGDRSAGEHTAGVAGVRHLRCLPSRRLRGRSCRPGRRVARGAPRGRGAGATSSRRG